jgi:hypothetical protein
VSERGTKKKQRGRGIPGIKKLIEYTEWPLVDDYRCKH